MKEEIDKNELLKFIAEAHRNTYAAPRDIKLKYRCKTPILPGHKDYHFKNRDWKYHDSYAGSVWAPGREVVFLRGEPVWCMSYQSQTNDRFSDEFFEEEVFPFLKKALRSFDDSMPFRGLNDFQEGDFKYSFKIDGDYRYFRGKEQILKRYALVFF